MPDFAVGIRLLYGVCGATYLGFGLLILLQAARRGRVRITASLLAIAAASTSGWAVAAAWQAASPLGGLAGMLDLLRALVWYGFVLHLFRRARPTARRAEAGAPIDALAGSFTLLGATAFLAVAAAVLSGHASAAGIVSLASPGLALRLALALCQLLLLENLYRNTEPEQRWNVTLACVGLGGLAAFDLVLCADAALFHHAALPLVGARPVVAILVCPLLALAAVRNRVWSIDIHVSRRTVFHTATLVVCGAFLLAVAASAQLARSLGNAAGTYWGGAAQASLLFAGFLAVGLLLTSGSARSLLRFGLVDPFFTHRYDYRQEWMRCIDTLSDNTLHTALHGRVVRVLAQVLDSPAGMLLLREPEALGLHWAESWNMPQLAAPLAPGHPLLAALDAGAPAIALGRLGAAWAPLDPAWDAWLAIPLRHAGRLAGCVLVTRPRAPFRLDPEVFELLRILAHEVASYLAEQRAARVLLETRELRAYGERFAFVAHDIKNVSSQLSLLLSNAETHLANPDFQRDMLLTVRASVRKIGALIRRLESPEQLPAQPPQSGAVEGPEPAHPERLDLLVVVEHLESLASRMRRLRGAAIVVDHNGCGGCVAMDSAVFDSVITHLLDNAIEASGVGQPVHLRLREEAGRAVVEIIDSGHGMQPEFVRDQLFRPFRTSKQRGSGIGAFQARALLRAASGDLLVESRPGMGTTMRLLLPLAPPQVVRLTA